MGATVVPRAEWVVWKTISHIGTVHTIGWNYFCWSILDSSFNTPAFLRAFIICCLQILSFVFISEIHRILGSLVSVHFLAEHWEKNNNICTVQSESSTFASLSFDQGLPKKRPPTGPSSQSECHLVVFCIALIIVDFVNKKTDSWSRGSVSSSHARGQRFEPQRWQYFKLLLDPGDFTPTLADYCPSISLKHCFGQ